MTFFGELKRRNVFRVAALYVVGSWLLLQIGDLLFDLMGLPDWALRIVLGILLLGFPAALVLAWIYEITPEGIRLEKDVVADVSISNDTGHKMNVAVIVLLVLVLVVLGVDRLMPEKEASVSFESIIVQPAAEVEPGQTETAPAASIAVLPFADLSPGGDQGYFSDGIAEEILNVLVDVEGLSVASRTSSFQFRNREGMGIPAIAKELAVRHVLEGSVRKAGDSIRITAQLIDAQTDQHLWSETFDRTLTIEILFAIQDEIASAIVDSIRSNLDVTVGNARAVPVRTENVDAYALYLKGRSIYRSRVALDEAERVLDRAFELDPSFADARAMQAAIYVIGPDYGYVLAPSSQESRERARELAGQALVLDPENALAFGVIGLSRQSDLGMGIGDWTYGDIVVEFNRALAIKPNDPSLLNWHGLTYLTMGYFERSERDFRHCTEFEPTYAPCRTNLALALIGLQRRDEANTVMLEAAKRGALGTDSATLLTLADLDRREAFLYVAAGLRNLRGWQANGELYDALRNPSGDHEQLRQRLKRFLEDNQREDSAAMELLTALGGHEHTTIGFGYWLSPFSEFRKSEDFRRLIKQLGISDYWHEFGFPVMCTPLGENDFICQ
jgi:TolB-like protein